MKAPIPKTKATQSFRNVEICQKSIPNIPTFSQANSFPEDLVYASGIEDYITVMRSAVMPKKISFRGSNGKKYSFLCKPKDDLRRDCRLLDFNNLLNKLFLKDPESRKRNLHLRTYVSCIFYMMQKEIPKIIQKNYFVKSKFAMIFILVFFVKSIHIIYISSYTKIKFSVKTIWNCKPMTLFRNKRFMLDEMTHQSTSKFAIFLEYEKWKPL